MDDVERNAVRPHHGSDDFNGEIWVQSSCEQEVDRLKMPLTVTLFDACVARVIEEIQMGARQILMAGVVATAVAMPVGVLRVRYPCVELTCPWRITNCASLTCCYDWRDARFPVSKCLIGRQRTVREPL